MGYGEIDRLFRLIGLSLGIETYSVISFKFRETLKLIERAMLFGLMSIIDCGKSLMPLHVLEKMFNDLFFYVMHI